MAVNCSQLSVTAVVKVTEEDRYLKNPHILPVFYGHSYTLTSYFHVRECAIDGVWIGKWIY
jgi:hypothetical protein